MRSALAAHAAVDASRVGAVLRSSRRVTIKVVGPVDLPAAREVLAYGVSTSVLSTNVAAFVKAPRKQHGDSKAKEVWEPQELLQFRAVADADEWAAAWRLTLCGLRRSEVLGMRWDAVDLVNGEVRVEAGRALLNGHRPATDDPKSSASRRTVPVEDCCSPAALKAR